MTEPLFLAPVFHEKFGVAASLKLNSATRSLTAKSVSCGRSPLIPMGLQPSKTAR